MNEPTHAKQFDHLNPFYFVKKLNTVVDSSEGRFLLGEPRTHQTKKPLASTRNFRGVTHSGTLKWPLLRVAESGGILAQLASIEDDKTFRDGYVIGQFGSHVEYGRATRYETMKIKIKNPHNLTSGLELRPLKIQVSAVGNDFPDVLVEAPTYHTRNRWSVLWRRADLSETIPVQWLLTTNARENYVDTEQRKIYAETVASEKASS